MFSLLIGGKFFMKVIVTVAAAICAELLIHKFSLRRVR